jgi:hypothetical protein
MKNLIMTFNKASRLEVYFDGQRKKNIDLQTYIRPPESKDFSIDQGTQPRAFESGLNMEIS